ncbi:MAG: glycyl-radical enzyme activating protein [Candidatus Neomarinimicrobiota bacterium]
MTASGLIFDIKHFAIHDGPGIRTTVFFKGCPLNCWWCHNPESRRPEVEELNVNHPGRNGDNPEPATVGRLVSVDEVMTDVLKDRVFYEQSGGGITISGGEPLLQPDFLVDLLNACRRESVATTIDTSGHATVKTLERLTGLVDLYLYDLKLMDEEAHRKHTGLSNAALIGNLAWLAETGVPIRVRVPLIPGVTDGDANLAAIARFVKALDRDIAVDILPFNLLARDKFSKFNLPNKLMHMQTQSPEKIELMGDHFRALDIPVIIGG